MPIIKVKTGTTTPGSLTQGEIAQNTTNSNVFVGNSSNAAVKVVGSIASQTANNVALTGGTVTGVSSVGATSAKFSGLAWTSGEYLYYDEGGNAAGNTGNWNFGTTTSMNPFADFGSASAHGWDGSPRTYQLTINGIPAHTEVMYECVFHMVDSLDAEGYWYLYTSNSAGGDITQAQWFKQLTGVPYNLAVYNSTTFNWKGNQYYSTAPWGGVNRIVETGGANGYAKINTGWYSHTASSFIAKHYIPADQAIADEAGYISHVRLWIRGGQTNNFNNVNSSVANTQADLPTQAAVKAFIDGNYASTMKNLYSFTSNGTYTKSGSDVKIIKIICVGGGGGGRGYHESGGGGGFAERVLDASTISTVSVTVGGGSGGGYYFGFAGQGATTSFGSYCSAAGGYGANSNRSHAGGHGGVGSGGNVNMYGGGGGGHAPGHNNQQGGESGQGGGSYFGGTSPGRHGGNGFTNSTAPGAGAFGGAGNHNGGDGSTGICLVYEYK